MCHHNNKYTKHKKKYQVLIIKTIIHIFMVNKKQYNMKQHKTLYVPEETGRQFKSACAKQGLKMGFMLDKLIKEWLAKQEK